MWTSVKSMWIITTTETHKLFKKTNSKDKRIFWMTGRRAQVLLCVYMTSYVRWLIISGQAQVYIPEVAGDKYLADTEGAHNISSCHLLYSQLVICSSSSSSISSSSTCYAINKAKSALSYTMMGF